jgi:hypothetical protein
MNATGATPGHVVRGQERIAGELIWPVAIQRMIRPVANVTIVETKHVLMKDDGSARILWWPFGVVRE